MSKTKQESFFYVRGMEDFYYWNRYKLLPKGFERFDILGSVELINAAENTKRTSYTSLTDFAEELGLNMEFYKPPDRSQFVNIGRQSPYTLPADGAEFATIYTLISAVAINKLIAKIRKDFPEFVYYMRECPNHGAKPSTDEHGKIIDSGRKRLHSAAVKLNNVFVSLRLLKDKCAFPFKDERNWDFPEEKILRGSSNIYGFEHGQLEDFAHRLIDCFDRGREFINWLIEQTFVEQVGTQPRLLQAFKEIPNYQDVIGDLDQLIGELERVIGEASSTLEPVARALTVAKLSESPAEVDVRRMHEALVQVYGWLDLLRQHMLKKRMRVSRATMQLQLPSYQLTGWLEVAAAFVANNWGVIVGILDSMLKIFPVVSNLEPVASEDIRSPLMSRHLEHMLRILPKLEEAAVGKGIAIDMPTPYVWPFDGSDFLAAAVSQDEFKAWKDKEFVPVRKALEDQTGSLLSVGTLVGSVQNRLAEMHSAVFGSEGVIPRSVLGLFPAVQALSQAVDGVEKAQSNTDRSVRVLADRLDGTEVELRALVRDAGLCIADVQSLKVKMSQIGTFGQDAAGLLQRLVVLEETLERLRGVPAKLEALKADFVTKDAHLGATRDLAELRAIVASIPNRDHSSDIIALQSKVAKFDIERFGNVATLVTQLDYRISAIEGLNLLDMRDQVVGLVRQGVVDRETLRRMDVVLREFPIVKRTVSQCAKYINSWGITKSFEQKQNFEAIPEEDINMLNVSRGQNFEEPQIRGMFGSLKNAVAARLKPKPSLSAAYSARDWLRVIEILGVEIKDFNVPNQDIVAQWLSGRSTLEKGDEFVIEQIILSGRLPDLAQDEDVGSEAESNSHMDSNELGIGAGDEEDSIVEEFLDIICCDRAQDEWDCVDTVHSVSVSNLAGQHLFTCGQNVEDAGSGKGDEHVQMEAEVKQDVKVQIDDQYHFHDTRETILQNMHPTMRIIASGRSPASGALTKGDILWHYRLSDMKKKATGHFAGLFDCLGVIPGGLAVAIKWKISPLNGVALALVYFESGLSSINSVLPEVVFPHPHRTWNPACEDSVIFSFQPFSCVDTWHPDFLDNHEGVVALVQMSGWHAAPFTMAHFSWSLSYVSGVDIPERPVCPISLPASLPFRQMVGALEFKANDAGPCRTVEFNLGSPLMTNAGHGYHLWQSLLSHYRYWKADMHIEVLRASSPFTMMTFGLALLPGSRSRVLNATKLQAYPHIEFTLNPNEGRKVLHLPKHLLGYMTLSDSGPLVPMEGPPQTLVVWLLDNPSNQTGESCHIIVSILGLENLEVSHLFPGYMPDSNRANISHLAKFPTRVVLEDNLLCDSADLSYQHGLYTGAQNAQVWCLAVVWNVASIPAAVPPRKVVGFLLNGFRPYVLKTAATVPGVPLLPAAMPTVVMSPVVRILYSGVWFRGTLLYRLVWSSKPDIKTMDWMGMVRVSVYGENLLSLRQEYMTSALKSGSMEFSVNVSGPIGGYYLQDSKLEHARDSSQVLVELVNHEQFAHFEVYVAFAGDCEVVGPGCAVTGRRTGMNRDFSFKPGKYE